MLNITCLLNTFKYQDNTREVENLVNQAINKEYNCTLNFKKKGPKIIALAYVLEGTTSTSSKKKRPIEETMWIIRQLNKLRSFLIVLCIYASILYFLISRCNISLLISTVSSKYVHVILPLFYLIFLFTRLIFFFLLFNLSIWSFSYWNVILYGCLYWIWMNMYLFSLAYTGRTAFSGERLILNTQSEQSM